MPTFRKKPVVIEAWQLSFANHQTVAHLIASAGYNVRHYTKPPMRTVCGLIIETLEGNMEASYGDWIIKGVNGEFYPCKPDIFDKSYEPVETDMSQMIADMADAVIDGERYTRRNAEDIHD